jgi:hypothetical protein
VAGQPGKDNSDRIAGTENPNKTAETGQPDWQAKAESIVNELKLSLFNEILFAIIMENKDTAKHIIFNT